MSKLIKEFKANGFKCTIFEMYMGHLCGYLHIPRGHALWGKHYNDIDVDVHGGLTYSQPEGEDWVIGFDCAHLGDLVPLSGYRSHGVYRDEAYVTNELVKLSEQIKPSKIRTIKRRLKRFLEDIIEAFFGLFTGAYRDE